MEAIKERWIAHNQDCIPARLTETDIVQVCLADDATDIYIGRAFGYVWRPYCGIIGYRIVKGSEE